MKRVVHHQKTEWVNDQVEIIYFPQELHTKLRIGDTVYAKTMSKRDEVLPDKLLSRLGRMANGAQIRFALKVTPQELTKLQSYIDSGMFTKAITCTHAACKTLNKNTGIWMPTPLNLLPATNAIFLALNRIVPGGRVTSIKITGATSEKIQGIGATSIYGISEAGAYLIVSTIGYNLIVPIFSENEESNGDLELEKN